MVVRYKDLGAVDLKRLSTVQYTRARITDNPLPTSCPAILTPTGTIWSDDFNRADSDHLGPDWSEFVNAAGRQNNAWYGIRTNQIRAAEIPQDFGPPDTFDLPKAARFIPMPTTVKDQYAQFVFQGSTPVLTSGVGPTTFGNNCSIVCRMNDYAPGNGWYEAGAGGLGTKSGWVGYVLTYSETWSTVGPAFQSALLNLARHDISGNSGFASVAVPQMVAGDVLQITAANFIQFGQENVCLKGFINGVLKVSGNDFSGPILPNIQLGRQLTGGAGILVSEQSSALATGYVLEMFWDDWSAQACLPNPT